MVTPGTIATALGRPTPAEGSVQWAQWDMWIDDAERAIHRRADRLGIDFASLDPEDVDFVIREAVVARARNPESFTSVDVKIDDGSVSKRFGSGASTIAIDDDWWDLLGLTEPKEAFSIRPSYTPGRRVHPVRHWGSW